MGLKEPPHFSQIILPEQDWGLSFPNNPPFNTLVLDLFENESGKIGIHFHGNKGELSISIILEEQDEVSTPTQARDFFFERALTKIRATSSFPVTQVNQWMLVDFAIGEFLIEEPDLTQKHWNAYNIEDSVLIDIQLSKLNYVPEDESLFKDILSSFKIEDTKIDSIIALGTYFRSEEKYDEAVAYFGHVFRDQDFTRMSIEQKQDMSIGLILSYFPFDFSAAMGAAEFGINEVDSSCPDFYYMKAMLFCLLKKPDKINAVTNLENTLKYWDNRIGDDQFFNIHQNLAFQRITKNKAFRSLQGKWPIKKT